ncbi:MAG: HAMP domain-containing histidine kinase [Muribaculum sp.]
MKLRYFLALSIIIFATLPSLSIDKEATIDSLRRELKVAQNPDDSITILYNMYDLSPRPKKGAIGLQIYSTAARLGRTDIQLDIIRNNTSLYIASDSIINSYVDLVRKLPDSEDKRETLAYIDITYNSNRIRVMPEAKRQEVLQEFIREYSKNPGVDLYDQVRRLYKLCVFLGASSQGDLYVEYLNKLGDLIEQLPEENSEVLRNMYLVQKAMIDTDNGQHAKAVASDKKLLEVIKHLKDRYISQGRLYRNYDVNEYLCYRRLLGNYDALTPKEVDDYYGLIMDLVASNPDVKKDFDGNRRAEIYYLIATKRYREALPLLKNYIYKPQNNTYKRKLLKFYTIAAKATGDKDALLAATTDYNTQLEDYINLQAAEKYKELQIIYDVNNLKAEKAQAELERHSSAHTLHNRILVISLIASGILALMLIVIGRLYLKNKRSVKNLAKSQESLQTEKQNLLRTQQDLIIAKDQAESISRLKTQFIQNVRHEILTPLNGIVGFSQLIADSVPADRQAEMSRYTDIITENSDQLVSLLADALDISMIDAGEMPVNLQLWSLSDICRTCVDNVKHRAAPGVKMIFVDPGDNFKLLTDRVRTEKILTNYLNNAAKFTEKGSITLTYNVLRSQRQVVFSVTDTGIGIPEAKHAVIFERFEKLNNSTPGTGLGLHICQLSARLLGGIAKVDPEYRTGARFLFIHPLKEAPVTDQGTEGTL